MQNHLNDSRAAFPNRIRALIVDNDARFLKSASLMLSLLNFLVATCETPLSAVKLLGERLKDADVVFIDALRATTCGFDFRGLVEPHMRIPVIYFYSFNYMATGEVAEALLRNVCAATYVIKKPLDAKDLCILWRVIRWSKFLLQRGENTLPWTEWARGNRPLPAAVQALFPSSSTIEGQGEEEENDSDLFKVVMAGRGQRRNLGDSHGDGSSCCGRGHGGRGVACSLEIGGQPTRRLEQMNAVIEEQGSDHDDVVPIYQLQPAQQNQEGVQVTDVPNQHHGQSLFMQPVLRMLNLPHSNPMISADAVGPSSSNVAAFVGPSNTSAPALLQLPVYQAPARGTSPAPHAVHSAQAPELGLSPLVYQQPQQESVAAARAGRGRPRRMLDHSHDGGPYGRGRRGVAVGHSTRRHAQMNMIHGQESDDIDMIPSHQQCAQQNRRGVQAMDVQHEQHSQFMQRVSQMLNVPRHNPMISADAGGPSSSNMTTFACASSISTPAPAPVLPPVHQHQQQPVALNDFGNMVAPPEAAVPTMAATTGHQPQFTFNQQQRQDMFAPQRQSSWMGRHRDTGPIMLSFPQPPVADAGAYGDAVVAHLQSPSVGAQPADYFHDVQDMMEMNDAFLRSYYANSLATDKLSATQATLDTGSNYNVGSFLVTDVNSGNSASFNAPQDPAVPTGNQVDLGAPDINESLMGSPGPSAMFNENGDMAAMFPSDQYDENAMISLDALWDFDDDIPMHPEGQQAAAADSATDANATGMMSNGSESGGC